jgi:hypothetical protein
VAVQQLYRVGASIGNGGTADAVRAGAGHLQKAYDYAVYLSRWIESNPGADATDIQAANEMLTDLLSALSSQPYPGK